MPQGRYSINLNAYNSVEYHKAMGLHCCDWGNSLSDDAVTWCHEDEDNLLWCGNSEYSSVVNFCPDCGFKSREKN